MQVYSRDIIVYLFYNPSLLIMIYSNLMYSFQKYLCVHDQSILLFVLYIYFGWLLVVLRRSDCVVRYQFYIYNLFFKTTQPIVTIFSLKHFQDKRNLNFEMYVLKTKLSSWMGPNMQKAKKPNSFLLPHMCTKN